jgi:pyruvate ferredoxin oxidoreductase alpha subunit
MVCMDGFVLTHAVEEVDLPDQDAVDAFLPPFTPRQLLDPADPVTIGAMVGPEAFTEVRYLLHTRMQRALTEIPAVAEEFRLRFGRPSGGLVHRHRIDDADTVVVTLGSAHGAATAAVDELRTQGARVGALAVACFRPWPAQEIREALASADRVVVVERAFAPGAGGVVGPEVRQALAGTGTTVVDVVAGLGGRPVTRADLRSVLDDVRDDLLDPAELHFLGLDRALLATAGEG